MRILCVGLCAVMAIVLLQITCATLYEDGPVSINEQLAQEGCTDCHNFPPDSGQHDYHITREDKQCHECHFLTLERDTFPIYDIPEIGDTTYRFPDQKMKVVSEVINVNDTVYDTIPIIIEEIHLNNKVNVAFNTRFQDSINPGTFNEELSVWDNSAKTCAKMANCHSQLDPAHFQLELWYGPRDRKK